MAPQREGNTTGSASSGAAHNSPLFEFVPYYGTDAAVDARVRAMIEAATPHELQGLDVYGNTLLILAAQYKAGKLIPLILARDCIDINAVNDAGACALHFACYSESLDVTAARAFLAAGSKVDVAERTYGCTPLHYAAGTGNIELCQELVRAGASVATCDYNNFTAVDYARQASMHACEAFLAKVLAGEGGGGAGGGSGTVAATAGRSAGSPSAGGAKGQGARWTRHRDVASGQPYHINGGTGESMWEKDLLQEVVQLKSREQAQPDVPAYQWLLQQTHQARLAAVVGRCPPPRLTQLVAVLRDIADNLSKQLPELARDVGVQEDALVANLLDRILDHVKGGGAVQQTPASPSKGTSPCTPDGGMQTSLGAPKVSFVATDDGVAMAAAVATAAGASPDGAAAAAPPRVDEKTREERIQKLQQDLRDATQRHEAAMEHQRAQHRDALAAHEGAIASLSAQIEEATAGSVRAHTAEVAAQQACKVLEGKLSAEADSHRGELEQLAQLETSLQAELRERAQETVGLASEMEGHQSGATEAADAARREADQRAAEEARCSMECQAAVAEAAHDVETVRSKFERECAAQRTEVSATLKKRLQELHQAYSTAKAKAAMDMHKAASDRDAARVAAQRAAQSRADATEEQTRAARTIEAAKSLASANVLLQAYMAQETERRKQLHNKVEDLKGKIRVYVRVRPLSSKEVERACAEAVCNEGKQSVVVADQKSGTNRTWDFDQVWAGPEVNGNTQDAIFRDTGYLVTSAVDGYNVCIFAYGQTGSGKTYTMFGAGGVGGGMDTATGQCGPGAGVAPRAVGELFRVLKERQPQYSYNVTVTMFELYRDSLRDLQAKKNDAAKLTIKLAEHSGTGLVVVEGGVEVTANSVKEMVDTIQAGADRRAVSSTQMNADSSRSHLICSMVISSTNVRTGSVVRGKLTLVDLAGSERVGKSGAAGDQLKEAQSINKSLSALGDVIGALTTGSAHIPYRNHPLTMMMSDSLGGNSKTLMFVCASPADYNTAETINSLQFAARCKDVTNSSVAGGAAQLQALQRELNRLKAGDGGAAPKKPAQLGRPV